MYITESTCVVSVCLSACKSLSYSRELILLLGTNSGRARSRARATLAAGIAVVVAAD